VATKIGTINPATTGSPTSGLPIPGGWNPATSYAPGDSCLTGYGYYLCLIANTNVRPDTDDAFDGTLYWRLLAPRIALIPNLDDTAWDSSRGYQRGSVVTIANGFYWQPNDYLVTGQDPRNNDGHWTLLGYFVPAGGTTGQVLTKQSAADGDYVWADPPAGGGANTPTAPMVDYWTTGDGTGSTATVTATKETRQNLLVVGIQKASSTDFHIAASDGGNFVSFGNNHAALATDTTGLYLTQTFIGGLDQNVQTTLTFSGTDVIGWYAFVLSGTIAGANAEGSYTATADNLDAAIQVGNPSLTIAVGAADGSSNGNFTLTHTGSENVQQDSGSFHNSPDVFYTVAFVNSAFEGTDTFTLERGGGASGSSSLMLANFYQAEPGGGGGIN
jgi:hypothetical protein